MNEYEPDEKPDVEPETDPTPDRADFNESPFRAQVRDILDLDWSARDERIFDELRRLKDLNKRVGALDVYVAELEERLA